MIALEDLKKMSEDEVKDHIAEEYAESEAGKGGLRAELNKFNIYLAYESVSSFFLLIGEDGKLWENHGSHCSCYGFEGQWCPEETTKEALSVRKFFCLGGYDSDEEGNTRAIEDAIRALP